MVNASKKYFIKTFGCAANEADSQRLAAVLEKRGYRLAPAMIDADVIIINTCSVRESAENRAFGLVNKLTGNKLTPREGRNFDPGWQAGAQAKAMTPQGWLNTKNKQLTTPISPPRIILTGCMVGSAVGDRRRYPLSTLKKKLPGVDEFKSIGELLSGISVSPKIPIRQPADPKYPKSVAALVPIMEGCNHFCTYCVVPYARGEEVSRPFTGVVAEVEDLVARGYQDITLIGQNVNSYGKSFVPQNPQRPQNPQNFASLLRTLHALPGLTKISFLTSNPWDLTEDIIEAMSLPKIDRYLHLALQSGDDDILKRMNRGYTAGEFLTLVNKIRKNIPDIQISTDIIVGFPGETREAFENTVRLCQQISFVKAYVSRYSPRPGTAAAKFKDDVPPAEKKRRWQVLDRLINHQQK